MTRGQARRYRRKMRRLMRRAVTVTSGTYSIEIPGSGRVTITHFERKR